jgi:hypothetical protein
MPHARPLFTVDGGRRSRMARECLSRPPPDQGQRMKDYRPIYKAGRPD